MLGKVDWDISPSEVSQARYWPRIALSGNLSTYSHPNFRIEYKDGKCLIYDDWQEDGIKIPKGSQIAHNMLPKNPVSVG